MAFTYDITTDRGKIRFYIGDVTSGAGPLPGGANYTDAEVDAVLTLCGSWQRAAIDLLRAAAVRWATKASSLSLGDYSESRQQAKTLSEMADKLEATLPGLWSEAGLGTSTVTNITDISGAA